MNSDGIYPVQTAVNQIIEELNTGNEAVIEPPFPRADSRSVLMQTRSVVKPMREPSGEKGGYM